MKVHILSNRFIIFTLPSTKYISEEMLDKVIYDIQRENSMPIWKKIKADIFSCKKESLYFVYPEEIQNIYLASYALQYLSDYFTE